MSRREALGLVLVAALVLLGRWLRGALLMQGDGRWRDPASLDAHLPPLKPPAAAHARPARRTRPAAPLDPNTCPVDSLELLPGIGPAIAGRIAAARRRGVHFACARDMQEIRGIGPRTAQRIEPYLHFAEGDTAEPGRMRSARRRP